MILRPARYFSCRLLLVPGILILLLTYSSIAFAHPTASRSSVNLHFSTQERIGFYSGDDWDAEV